MVGFEFSYPGFLLGFSGGSYYQYKKLAPYVNQNCSTTTTTTAPPPTLAPLAPSYDEDYKVKEDTKSEDYILDYKVKEDTNPEDYILDYKVKEDANLDVKDDSKTKVATDEKIHADGVVYIEE